MKVPEGWVLVPRVPTAEMTACGHNSGWSGVIEGDHKLEGEAAAELYGRILAAAPPPPTDPEVEIGKGAPGLAGAVYRFIDRCDYREAMGWMRSEILRNTDQLHIIETIAGAIAGIAIGCAGNISRSQMRAFSQRVMILAANVLEKDIAELIAHKKAETVLHNRIRLVVPDGG